jgi:hypothetical protein
MTDELLRAIREVARAAALMLDEKRTPKPASPDQPAELLGFDDHHDISVRLPAWVLRTFKGFVQQGKAAHTPAVLCHHPMAKDRAH